MHPLMMELLPLARQGWCCSQLLVLLMLQMRGEENAALLRAAQGLCHGIGQSDGPCGLLTGGACALALAVGKGAPEESAHQMFTPLLNDYASWFYERTAAFGGQSCGCVAAGLGAAGESGPDMAACGGLLAECWEKILELLQSYDIEISPGL